MPFIGVAYTKLRMLWSNGTVYTLSGIYCCRADPLIKVPSEEEVAFVLEIIDQIGKPALQIVNSLVQNSGTWDNVARNDFCRFVSILPELNPFLIVYRYLNACRAILIGLPTFLKENFKNVAHPCINEEHEVAALVISQLDVSAGFTLTDPKEPRYQKVLGWRTDFGRVILAASGSLRQLAGGEDHTDAVIGVTRAIDAFLLSYAVNRSEFDSLQKNYAQARE